MYKHVHLRFRLSQVTFHLLGSESLHFELSLEWVIQKADFDNDDWSGRFVDIASETNLESTVRVYKHVHLRFRLSQVTFHLLGSESLHFELSLEWVIQKADFDNDD
ncbi:MAG: hypothetical protein NAG76_14930 [Candidatus Pristimantibacillus lignocellulolyticus]|uniref:Uncharacterized protein n=1 Tax=Candidatus Pristimantibacillus lignocellulolyticus TaxID=2994561 RepID=A0A9J6ZAN5_9BACL|nr:MAG: hypothetical protein NAG76_14930 [Candidatus Pristimantibacillus lignocellulolyticus]